MTNAQLVYVVQEWPAKTQTFVEREIVGATRAGATVSVYPLRLAYGTTEEISVELARPRTRVFTLICYAHLAWFVLSGKVSREALGLLFLRWRPEQVARQILALAHAAFLAQRLRRATKPTWLHAHFFGRAAEVAVYTKLLVSNVGHLSITGHAGDVLSPHDSLRLSTLLEHTDMVSCASDAVQNRIREVMPSIRSEVIHCGVSDAYLIADRPVAGERPGIRILTVARLVPKKGLDLCITAAKHLESRIPGIEWNIVGDGPLLDELRADIRAKDAGSVRLLGHLPNDRVRELVTSWADAFVLPVRIAPDGDSDGIPVALMEAMASSLPVITTPIAGIPELIVSGVNGVLVPADDAIALVDAVEDLYSNPERRVGLGRAGHDTVAQHFRSDREAERLLVALGLS